MQVARGASPELALAVAEAGRDRGLLVPVGLLLPRVVERVERVRAREREAGGAGRGEFGPEGVGDGDAEPPHRLAAVRDVFDEDAGLGGRVHVEVGAQRPRDVPAGAGGDDAVLLVRVVAGLVRVVLRVDDRRRAGVGDDHAGAEERRADVLGEAADGAVARTERLVGEDAGPGAGDDLQVRFAERVAAREAGLAAAVDLVHLVRDLFGGKRAVPEEDFAEGDAGAGGLLPADGGLSRRAGDGAAQVGEHVQVGPGLHVADFAAVENDPGRAVRPKRERDVVPAAVFRIIHQAGPGRPRGVFPVDFQIDLFVVGRRGPDVHGHEVAGVVGRAPGPEREDGTRVVVPRVAVQLRPEHHGAAVRRVEVGARRERGGGIGRVEVDAAVLRIDRLGGAATLRGDDDLRRLPGFRPARAVDLRERRDFDRGGHPLLLDRRVPPDLDRLLRDVDRVDHRRVRVGVGAFGGGGRGLVRLRGGGRLRLAVEAVVEVVARDGRIDVAGAVGVAGGRERPRRAGDRAAAKAQLGADGDRLLLEREVLGVGAQDRMERDEPDVVVDRELQERPALVGRPERAVGLHGAGVALGVLVAHQRRREGVGDVDRAARVAVLVAADEHGGVLRPVALVLVELERPLDEHLVGLHPVHLRVPAAADGGAQREDGAVLRAVGMLALVLVEVVAAVVRGLDDGGARAQAGGRVAAAVGLELAADLARHRVHDGAADLDRLHVQEALEGACVVVGHHDLPLQLAVGVEHLGRRVVVEAGDDAVREDLGHAGGLVRVDAVGRLHELVGAVELHELAAQVDRRAVVGVVRPVDAARAAGAAGRDDVGHLDRAAVLEDPREPDRSAERGVDALAGGVTRSPR